MMPADAPYNKRSLRDYHFIHKTQSSVWYLCHRVCLTASLYAMFGFEDLEVTLFPRPALLSRPSASTISVLPWFFLPSPMPSFQPIFCSILLPLLSEPIFCFPSTPPARSTMEDSMWSTARRYFSLSRLGLGASSAPNFCRLSLARCPIRSS